MKDVGDRFQICPHQMNTTDNMPAVLLIATFDTKAGEALYLQRKIESLGCRVLSMDTGILQESGKVTDINRRQVAKAGGSSIQEMVASGDKGKCIRAMRKGACVLSRKLYDAGEFQGVISIGGAQGTDIGTATMRGARGWSICSTVSFPKTWPIRKFFRLRGGNTFGRNSVNLLFMARHRRRVKSDATEAGPCESWGTFFAKASRKDVRPWDGK